MGVFSFWGLIVYVIFPAGLVLLLLLTCPPGRRNSGAVKSLVENVIFSRLNFLPYPLVTFLLGLLSLVFTVEAIAVYNYAEQLDAPAHDFELHLAHQMKGFRKQRNLYLTALALVTWWAVFGIYKLQLALDGDDGPSKARGGKGVQTSTKKDE